MYMEVKLTIAGEDYILKGTATKVSVVQNNYKDEGKALRKIIKKMGEPKTLARIKELAHEKESMSIRMVKKILELYDGILWQSSPYQNPAGGKQTTQYEVLKKEQ